MQDRKKYTASSAMGRLIALSWWQASAEGFALIAGALFIIALGRVYGPIALGKFSFALALCSVVQTLSLAGYDITLPRDISREPERAHEHCRSALQVKILLWALIVPFACAASVVKDAETILCTIILALDVVPSTIAYGYVSALRGLQQAPAATRLHAFWTVITMLSATATVFMHAPLWLFATLMLIGDTLKMRALHMQFSQHVHKTIFLRELFEPAQLFRFEILRAAWSSQRDISLTNLLSSLLVRMPTLMLGWIAGDLQNGIYSAAARFFTALRIVPGAVLHSIVPSYTAQRSEQPRIRGVMLVAVISAILMSAVLYVGAPFIMHLSFGFEASVPVLQALALGFGALFIKTTVEAFLLAAHRERELNHVLLVVCLIAVGGYMAGSYHSALQVAQVMAGAELILMLSFVFVLLRSKRLEQGAMA